ncbi:MAG: CbrC family protein [Oscillospiraceae bacterium]|nr:CbrC family protein [Oscillospiraceae bacterium]
MPYFKYHPDPIRTGVFQTGQTVACSCCGKETDIWLKSEHICPDCIHSGKAYDKFGADSNLNSVYDYNTDYREQYTGMIDEANIEELLHRTPGYLCNQYPVWPVHCNDFCAYIMTVHEGNLIQMGILEEIKTYLRKEGAFDEGDYGTEMRLKNPEAYAESILIGGCDRYLFRCLHCRKYLLRYDYD